MIALLKGNGPVLAASMKLLMSSAASKLCPLVMYNMVPSLVLIACLKLIHPLICCVHAVLSASLYLIGSSDLRSLIP